jgi:hypothetical protein
MSAFHPSLTFGRWWPAAGSKLWVACACRVAGASEAINLRVFFMPVVTTHQPAVPEPQMIQEMARDGFEAATKDYGSGTTEPHQHDYEVCLYILEGEFRLREVARSIVHRFGPWGQGLRRSGHHPCGGTWSPQDDRLPTALISTAKAPVQVQRMSASDPLPTFGRLVRRGQ